MTDQQQLMIDGLEVLQFASPAALCAWLAAHQDTSAGLWLTLAKKGSRTRTVTYLEALDSALQYGWIDGLARRHDSDTYLQRFTPRRRRSPWSLPNRRRAEAMIAAGRMAPRGLAEVERAKSDGRWPATTPPTSVELSAGVIVGNITPA